MTVPAGMADGPAADTEAVAGSLSRRAARGGLLTFAGEASQRLAQVVCFTLLAGLLSPADFGLAAVAFLAVQIGHSLSYAGLGQALQTLGADERRDRTAVGLALVSGSAAAALLVAVSVPFGGLMQAPEAAGLVRLVALSLPLLQLAEVLAARLDREFRYTTTASAQVIGSIAAVVTGVGLALAGAGPVALVAQSVVQQAMRLSALVLLGRPSLRVALHRGEAADLWRFGRVVLVTTVLFTIYGNVDNFVVGAVLGPASLGNYSFAYNLALIAYFLLSMTSTRTLVPVFARVKAAGESLARVHQQSASVTMTVAMLPLGFLALAGLSAVRVVFGDRWDDAGSVLRLLTVFSYLGVVGATSVPVLLVTGRATIQRRIQFFQLVALLACVYPATRWFGIEGTCVAVAIPALGGSAFLLHHGARASGERFRNLLKPALLALLVGLASGSLGALVLNRETWPALLLSLLVTTVAWSLLALLTVPAAREEALRLLRFRRQAGSLPESTD